MTLRDRLNSKNARVRFEARKQRDLHNQLRAELVGECSAMPKAEADYPSERARPPVRHWWAQGAFA